VYKCPRRRDAAACTAHLILYITIHMRELSVPVAWRLAARHAAAVTAAVPSCSLSPSLSVGPVCAHSANGSRRSGAHGQSEEGRRERARVDRWESVRVASTIRATSAPSLTAPPRSSRGTIVRTSRFPPGSRRGWPLRRPPGRQTRALLSCHLSPSGSSLSLSLSLSLHIGERTPCHHCSHTPSRQRA
jgi:hypothetical protein